MSRARPPKKSRLGQNFLVDASAQQRIVSALGNPREKASGDVVPGRSGQTLGDLAANAAAAPSLLNPLSAPTGGIAPENTSNSWRLNDFGLEASAGSATSIDQAAQMRDAAQAGASAPNGPPASAPRADDAPVIANAAEAAARATGILGAASRGLERGDAAALKVVEIGPGHAALTDLLAERFAPLTAIELDPELARTLRVRFAGNPGVEILEADVLSVDFAALAPGPGRSLLVIGNLPYYITSPILQHLFAHEHAIARAVLMVQREVAERLVAVPGTSDYGLLSVVCRLHARAELLFTLPPEAFDPPPAVHSAVVRLEFAPRWVELGLVSRTFLPFLKACFAQKRKLLANNLRAAGLARAPIAEVLARLALPATVRAEQLEAAEFAALFHELYPRESAEPGSGSGTEC